jgi:hypothetical protein
MNEEYEQAKTRPLSSKDLDTYLKMLDKKAIHYRAERVLGRTSELHNLKLLDDMSVEAMARPQSQAPRGEGIQ